MDCSVNPIRSSANLNKLKQDFFCLFLCLAAEICTISKQNVRFRFGWLGYGLVPQLSSCHARMKEVEFLMLLWALKGICLDSSWGLCMSMLTDEKGKPENTICGFYIVLNMFSHHCEGWDLALCLFKFSQLLS